MVYHAVISALSAYIAVIPSGHIRTVKPIATPPDDIGTGNHFLTGYNRSKTYHWTSRMFGHVHRAMCGGGGGGGLWGPPRGAPQRPDQLA